MRPVALGRLALGAIVALAGCAKMADRAPHPQAPAPASGGQGKRGAEERQSDLYELQVEAKPAEGEPTEAPHFKDVAKAESRPPRRAKGDFGWDGPAEKAKKSEDKAPADKVTLGMADSDDGTVVARTFGSHPVQAPASVAAPSQVLEGGAKLGLLKQAGGAGLGGIGLRGFGSGGGSASTGRLHGLGGVAPATEKADTDERKEQGDAQARGQEEVDSVVDLPNTDENTLEAGDSGGNAGADACVDGSATSAPMPKRCHLAPNYRAGTALWQRKLQALATLPPALAKQIADGSATGALVPPETTALAVDAQLDRDHLDGPGQVWLRVGLRSTDRWGMRRPPFDLAIVVGSQAAQAPNRAACTALESLAERIEPQDRLTVVRSDKPSENLDGVAGVDVLQRVREMCAQPKLVVSAALAAQHAMARLLLANHAAAQHRVAGTRVIVVVANAAELDQGIVSSASQGVQEPTLTSVLLLGSPDSEQGWQLADSGHGMLQPAPPGKEAQAAAALWRDWGRVVARLVRVDIRLASNVMALRVVGSRALDGEETRRVRRQERAVDQNLARVAGVQRDRDQDGEGMTMLIPAFLGSDAHFIDMLLQVQGPGPVADVVVDYKDLVRMTNQKAAARASLDRVAQGSSRTITVGAQTAMDRIPWSAVARLGSALDRGDAGEMRHVAATVAAAASDGGFAALAQGIVDAYGEHADRAALRALLQLWIARAHGCRVAAETPRGT